MSWCVSKADSMGGLAETEGTYEGEKRGEEVWNGLREG